ncbi:MAG: DUF1836 domain-containing protein [Lachnospiraceae bacterium]|nr:DUF1836 domain-containing protein [Lachnospiraceae bacterium]
MTIDTSDILNSILESLEQIDYIRPGEIPNIDLYMDQVTTFMEENLNRAKRYPDDKILTKTMINNYAKNRLLPAPVKKKYSKEHMLLLIYIYYYKSFLSIGDIQKLLSPLTERYFQGEGEPNMESIYEEVFSLEKGQIERMKADLIESWRIAGETFQETDEEDRQFLQTFSFICLLSFDVYVKKQVIEKLIDEFSAENTDK